ncbi:MAG: TlpA disulfide reductase family protein [Hyphomonadaceae bacterium]
MMWTRRLFCHAGMGLVAAAATLSSANARPASLDPPTLRNGVSQFVLEEPLRPVPLMPLRGLDGRPLSMDKFRGKVVLLNFWASWCAPCVEEMPSIEALAAILPSDRFAVVAVALDGGDGSKVRSFVKQYKLQHLTVVLDPNHEFGALTNEGKPGPTMPVYGYPTTYILDKRGLVTGFLVGPTAWDSPVARSFIDYFIRLN